MPSVAEGMRVWWQVYSSGVAAEDPSWKRGVNDHSRIGRDSLGSYGRE